MSIPLLVVGTKVDEANGSRLPLHNRRSDIAEEFGTEEIHLNCNDRNSIGPGTSAATKLSRFFDKVAPSVKIISLIIIFTCPQVIARQFHPEPRRGSVTSNVMMNPDRRRTPADRSAVVMESYFLTGHQQPSYTATS